eukprot:s1155_g8.t4
MVLGRAAALAQAIAVSGEFPQEPVVSVAGRQIPLTAVRSKDRLDWAQLNDRLLGRCELPAGQTAGCQPLRLERVHDIKECLGVLLLTDGGDTINYAGEACQIQQCQISQAYTQLALTSNYGAMEVYSVLCEALKVLPSLEMGKDNRDDDSDVGKDQDYWTTSGKMKQTFRDNQLREVNAAGTSAAIWSSSAPAGSWRFSKSPAGADEVRGCVGFHHRLAVAARRRVQLQAILEDASNVHTQAIQRWVREVIIGYNFCPYAQPTASNGHIRVVTSNAEAPEEILPDLDAEAARLPSGSLKDLAEGEPATTLVVCPHVKAWQSFESFQEFYQGQLMNGYFFAEKDIYMVSFHPQYGKGRTIETGDVIEVGDQQAIVRDGAAGFSESGNPVAMVQLSDGQETYIELSQPVDATEELVSKAPRVALHLLRNCDLEEANDANIHRRNGVTIGEDLRNFFAPKASTWTILELGSYRGYTSRVFSDLFSRVIAVDASEAFLNFNRRYNKDRRNILFVHLHSRVDSLRSLRQNEVEVAMVDAEHEYASVHRDTNQLLRYFRSSLKYVIFDDFGTDEGVMRAVREFVQRGQLRVLGGVPEVMVVYRPNCP